MSFLNQFIKAKSTFINDAKLDSFYYKNYTLKLNFFITEPRPVAIACIEMKENQTSVTLSHTTYSKAVLNGSTVNTAVVASNSSL